MSSITINQIVQLTGGSLVNCANPEHEITTIHPLDSATHIPASVGFFKDKAYLVNLNAGCVDCILVDAKFATFIRNTNIPQVIVPDSYVAFAKVAQALDITPQPPAGIHPTAIVPASVTLGNNITIGAYTVIGEHVTIGDHTVIESQCSIGDYAKLGTHVRLHPQVVLYHHVELDDYVVIHSLSVIGADGFGYANEHGTWIKIPQVGTAKIGKRTEIGALTSVDRGAINNTVVENDVILDNHIHIAHNCKVGMGTAMAGGTVVAGSTTIGKYCIIGGASVINGHIKIADFVSLTGMAMVPHSLTESHKIYSSGLPVDDNKKWLRSTVMLKYDNLKDQANRIKSLEQQIKKLSEKE